MSRALVRKNRLNFKPCILEIVALTPFSESFKKINNQCLWRKLVPANHKVSVAWQIVFSFVPILNLWAFYRIKKLRKYFLYIIVPTIAVSIALAIYISSKSDSLEASFGYPGYFGMPFNALSSMSALSTISNAISIGLHAFGIYLVIIWSRQHNRQFDQPTTQTEAP